MELKNLPWYGQFLIFLAIGAILFGIFYFVQYSPTQDTIAGVQQEIDALDIEIRKAEQNKARLTKIQDELERNKGLLVQLKSVLPERMEISQILRKIQSLASNSRLRIQLFTPGAEISRDIYFESPIRIAVDGNYHNLAIFFDQVSRLKKIFNVDGLSITPLSSMSSEFTINANFTATTYIYRDVPVQVAPPPPRAPRGDAPDSRNSEEG